jgi:photosystem II stability/assembly factor-like uncharacterized protein
MAGRNQQKASQSRVWTLAGGAGPATSVVYQGLARALSPDWAGGDITPIRGPSSRAYSQYDDLDEIIGQRGLPTMSVETRKRRQISDLLTQFQAGCFVDLQAHVGSCQDPTDFLAFELIEVLERARLTNYSTSDQGAFDGDQEAIVTETLPFTGAIYYEIVPIRDSELGASEVQQEVIGVVVADKLNCGDCGSPSDGASVVFAVTVSSGGSPGLPAEVLVIADGATISQESIITTLGANEDPTGIAAVGTDVVVISNADEALHYAPIADLLAGTEAWTKVTTGIVSAKGPNAIFSLGRAFTWIVGDGGYVYFSADITAGVSVQSAGSVTAQNLNAIHGLDEDNLVAVGASNAVLVTENGGTTWRAVTGPNVGVSLSTVWMHSKYTWFIGDAGGNLWYTIDGGLNWTAKAFSGSGAGRVDDIQFATQTVGYMAHATATPAGRVFRTVDGGATWYRLPGTGLTLTANDRINSLAVPTDAAENIMANTVFAGGLADNATDGVLLKIA